MGLDLKKVMGGPPIPSHCGNWLCNGAPRDQPLPGLPEALLCPRPSVPATESPGLVAALGASPR